MDSRPGRTAEVTIIKPPAWPPVMVPRGHVTRGNLRHVGACRGTKPLQGAVGETVHGVQSSAATFGDPTVRMVETHRSFWAGHVGVARCPGVGMYLLLRCPQEDQRYADVPRGLISPVTLPPTGRRPRIEAALISQASNVLPGDGHIEGSRQGTSACRQGLAVPEGQEAQQVARAKADSKGR